MPICTSCTHPIPYLYTVYESDSNIRLEQCSECHEFVDPYVEHDSLTISLDLILLKRGVYRHLLYNRGAEPRRLTGKNRASDSESKSSNVETDRWMLTLKLGLPLVLLDSFIRWSYLNADKSPVPSPIIAFLRVFLGTTAETVAFHGGVTLACYFMMKILDLFQSIPPQKSNMRQHFRLSLIPLSLFYSSITKLFLLFLLTIWLPKQSSHIPAAESPLPTWVELIRSLDNSTSNYLVGALQILDDDKLDREWIVRNVLGGMSAGFGLRVILDIHPSFTTIIILAGWAAKTAVATVVSKWVGGNDMARDAWLAYSIP